MIVPELIAWVSQAVKALAVAGASRSAITGVSRAMTRLLTTSEIAGYGDVASRLIASRSFQEAVTAAMDNASLRSEILSSLDQGDTYFQSLAAQLFRLEPNLPRDLKSLSQSLLQRDLSRALSEYISQAPNDSNLVRALDEEIGEDGGAAFFLAETEKMLKDLRLLNFYESLSKQTVSANAPFVAYLLRFYSNRADRPQFGQEWHMIHLVGGPPINPHALDIRGPANQILGLEKSKSSNGKSRRVKL